MKKIRALYCHNAIFGGRNTVRMPEDGHKSLEAGSDGDTPGYWARLNRNNPAGQAMWAFIPSTNVSWVEYYEVEDATVEAKPKGRARATA